MTMKSILIAFGFISIISCTVHPPFQSEQSKADYHLRLAYYHNPSLTDSVKKELLIKGIKGSFVIKPELPAIKPIRFIHDTIRLQDSTSGIKTSLYQDDSLNVKYDVNCPDQIIKYKTKTLEVRREVTPEWVWYVIGAMAFMIFIMAIIRR